MKKAITFLGWALLLSATYVGMAHVFGFERTVLILLACSATERIVR